MRLLAAWFVLMVFVPACSASPSFDVASPLTSVSGTRPPAGSPSNVPSATPVPFDVPLLADPANLTGICSLPPADGDSGLDCQQAFREAMRAAGPRSADVYRLEFGYGIPCTTSGGCASPTEDVGYVLLVSPDETNIVIVVRADDGRVQAWPPQPTTIELFRPDTFAAPAAARPSLPGDPPPALIDRLPLPYCGEAKMARIAPTSAERCFRNAVLSGQPAEILATGVTVEGADLLRVLRYSGAGPISVDTYESKNAHGEPGHWDHLLTVLWLSSNGGIDL